ncbi:copper chaperone PCu(A)C [Vibrio sp. TH_r3]|uniref:copper chaperone PCu(A)C n=1 Tax=Vibrio sp. TH_r3 TaxID=3082084 RepID=UPI002953F518|nr:copper chaperone PCu(A)C [Vibrio sp. TH_r3]MDV7104840.1 copper chaperone PCu(A)C [Vibrio sp. TH_r3]
MKPILILLTSAFTLLSTYSVFAAGLLVQHPYARATPPNAPTSAVFLTFENNSDQLREIVSASTPAAGKVELHTHIMQGEVMKMRQVSSITIEPMTRTELKPGGLHIMLFDLQQPFTEGKKIEVTVNFANGEALTFEAQIKKVMQGMKSHKMSHH